MPGGWYRGTTTQPLAAHVLPWRRIEDSEADLRIMTTDACDRRGVLLARGAAVPALLAGVAVPGFYPSVEIDGFRLIDGAVANGTTLEHAIEICADELYVLAPGLSCHLPAPPSTVLAMAIHAHDLLEAQRMAASIAKARPHVEVYVLPSPSPVEILPIDGRRRNSWMRPLTQPVDGLATVVRVTPVSHAPRIHRLPNVIVWFGVRRGCHARGAASRPSHRPAT